MKTFEIKIPVTELTVNELSAEDRELVEAAKEATKRSYAPYSKFHVGAAIRLDNGEIVTGSNQENAAYPSGTCAERTAGYYASSAHPGVPFRKIAIAAWTRLHADEKTSSPSSSFDSSSDSDYEAYFQASPISPCGACRQALLEYEALYGPIEVILYGSEKTWLFPSVSSLLPLTFTSF